MKNKKIQKPISYKSGDRVLCRVYRKKIVLGDFLKGKSPIKEFIILNNEPAGWGRRYLIKIDPKEISRNCIFTISEIIIQNYHLDRKYLGVMACWIRYDAIGGLAERFNQQTKTLTCKKCTKYTVKIMERLDIT